VSESLVVAEAVLRWVDCEYRRRRLGGMALYDWRAFGRGFHLGGGEVVRRNKAPADEFNFAFH